MTDATNASQPTFGFFQCGNDTCQFRFPAETDNIRAKNCPICGTRTTLTTTETVRHLPKLQTQQTLPLVGVVDNVRSLLNVGTIFRSSDGVGVQHLYLCGITATPNNPKLTKSALGTEATLAWSHHHNSLAVARDLKARGYQLWALEDGDRAISAASIATMQIETPIALIVGHERSGVDPELLAMCDAHIFLPMNGIKRSLNVATAYTTVAYLVSFAMTAQH